MPNAGVAERASRPWGNPAGIGFSPEAALAEPWELVVCKFVAKASKVRILDLPPRASLQVSGVKALRAPKAVGAFCYVSAIQGFPSAISSLVGLVGACSVFGIDRTPNIRQY